MTRAIVPSGILALSLAVVLLAATASTASAQAASAPAALGTWSCPPPSPPPTTWEQYQDLFGCLGGPSFNFGDRQVGTASPVRLFALGVGCPPGVYLCPGPLNPSIAVSGDYAQTNDCPATLSAGPGQVQGCLINVTFTPTGTGPKAGTLSTGPGGPTARLTGEGVTHATPPAFPLLFYVYLGYHSGLPEGRDMALLKKRLTLYASTNYDSRVVARGGVKRTAVRVAGSGPPKWKSTRFTAKLKHLRRLKESPTKPTVKIKFTATDEFGQRATDELEVRLCREVRHGGGCVR